jgi:SAM-dependent methyltransferase
MLPELLPTKENVSIFDIGCGSGYVRGLLERLGYSGSYTGLDVVREKRFADHESASFASTFIQQPIEDYAPERTYDLVISNTSFEHVRDDREAAKKARELAGTHGTEVHIVPSWWSFFVYLLHGYRHYTPGRIKELFLGSDYIVYPLGGCVSLGVQFLLSTIPERSTGRMVFRNMRWYPWAVRTAIALDRFLPLCPMGYAIVVRHE